MLEAELGQLPLVVEDLGTIDQETRDLQIELGFPGMRVLQFAFGSGPENEHLSQNHPEIAIAYSSTHDSDTVLGWWHTLSTEMKSEVWQSIVSEHEPLHHQLIDVALQSDAIWGIAPLQDWLGLGSEARFNTPGTSTGNWGWRVTSEQLAHLNPRTVRGRLQFSNRLPFRFQTQTHNQGVAK